MIQKIMEQFPGISCAWMNAAGEESAEFFGAADRENNIAVDDNIRDREFLQKGLDSILNFVLIYVRKN